tara:strand:- start:1503 stop:1712 length:210 start_codon:yes stop_codon:yes gene_type:complete
MEMIVCSGQWQQAQDGAVYCLGTLEMASVGPFGLPALTYGEANAILGAVALLFASVWGVRVLARVIRPY